MKWMIFLFLLTFFIANCGVKSPPLPPLEKAVTKQDTSKKKQQTPKKKVDKTVKPN